MFRRRDRRPIWRIVLEALWPRGGWGRAFYYVRHRLHRLPGTPENIARGIWAGVFTTFTPFYGFHFLTAYIISRVMKGNALAAVLATFFGNPLTYLPIGIASLRTGYWLLGMSMPENGTRDLLAAFGGAGADLWHNFMAIFNDERAHWLRLERFYDEIFFPYMIGGILPGIITATICYYLTVPLIRAYQKRRVAKMKKRIETLRLAREAAAAKGGQNAQ